MKHRIPNRWPLCRVVLLASASLLIGPAIARAAECPETSPEDPQERRQLAKDWFSKAESAESSGDDADATRAYACSYKMVAHPFTAYNLARVAERVGDSELALKMFKAYLTLKPDAPEKEKVKAKIKVLEEKVAAGGSTRSLSDGVAAAAGAGPNETGGTSAVEDVGAGAATSGQGVETAEPPPPPKPARPRPVAQTRRAAEPESEPEPPSRLAEWLVGSVAVGALVGGLVANLSARSKMSACRTSAENGLLKTAQNECDEARPYATASYVLFGLAAAGAALDTVLLIVRRGSDDDDSSSASLMILPGGAGLTLRGRF